MKKLLFVCTINRMRSKTAEDIFKDNPDFEVKSCGTDAEAAAPVSKELLEWADYIFVMEKKHRNHIHKHFPDIYREKMIICLYIDDIYDYMDPDLITILKEKVLMFFSSKKPN